MGVVFFYAVLGGMKGITYTQVAQYCVLIFAYMVPAIFIAIQMTGNPVPQLGLGGTVTDGSGVHLLDRLDELSTALGFDRYTGGSLGRLDLFCITAALMLGTAGLPHVIVRFYTVKRVSAARISAGWALLFIAVLYTTAPAIAAFVRTNLLETVPNTRYVEAPDWLARWESTGLVAWVDKDGDGVIRYAPGPAIEGKPAFDLDPDGATRRGRHGEVLWANAPTDGPNELYIDRDIMVLANPQIARLPDWVTALVAAGGLAAALSTAAGLLLVISSSIAHDLTKKLIRPDISDRGELRTARITAGVAVLIAGYFGINPPDYVAAVVAFAFGLAASSFFPAIIMGIFSKRMNVAGVVTGMVVGLGFTASYIIWFKFLHPDRNSAEYWWFGISPEGIGTLGMVLNVAVAWIVAACTPPPPAETRRLVESIRLPD